jgi:hypothetical protein
MQGFATGRLVAMAGALPIWLVSVCFSVLMLMVVGSLFALFLSYSVAYIVLTPSLAVAFETLLSCFKHFFC